jgi:hypothetical protein
MRACVCAFFVTAALTCAAVAAAGPASGGGGEAVTCRFDVHRSQTECRHSTVTVTARACVDPGYRLYSRDESDSVRRYRGNVILSSLDAMTAAGGYALVVRPHVRPLSDSGPHAFSESFTVDDTTCTG